ncbi:hypothetical protein PCANC_10044 [Puccinia coronata f. sp. avenae]|uniref:Uncharacterized protein n=1 Tax=Puccinia coronata f. sp. avenae TaxID=200324 RepID=A0A2N5URJ1_9BASI|nr:hypothetical protein PCANC_25978 [Puccinia coronata f. sp. avenae]PLW13941.1 hypothetical protein PCASD_19941 [Puccinia coronata f. sp. avenae]PLW40378.1 hypothetical protein PCASD_07321 [Puccinia coronata f. sp. avenae]PLW42993.1 hypothetical protein PCANC_10044 [Puccinia coronata f. sp. avenae]
MLSSAYVAALLVASAIASPAFYRYNTDNTAANRAHSDATWSTPWNTQSRSSDSANYNHNAASGSGITGGGNCNGYGYNPDPNCGGVYGNGGYGHPTYGNPTYSSPSDGNPAYNSYGNGWGY